MNQMRSGVDWRSDDAEDGGVDPRVGIVAGVVSVAVLAVAFGLLALDQWWFWIAFPIGYGGVLPLATAAAAWAWSDERRAGSVRSGPEPTAVDEDDLAAVEREYVEGRLDEAAFERELEAVLEREHDHESAAAREREPDAEREGRRE